jgi:hypothetical protein
MQFHDFADLVSNATDPVILIEGRRSIPEADARNARRLSIMLATRFPQLRFRSGNASGADEAFCSGITATAPERLEIIAPYASHRRRERHPLVRYESPESLDPAELARIQRLTIAATPANHRLMQRYGKGGRAGAQAACLIRDTMKVAGIAGTAQPHGHAMTAPIAALFWIDPEDPEAGGTGHTIRACRLANVPVLFQNHWDPWLNLNARTQAGS